MRPSLIPHLVSSLFAFLVLFAGIFGFRRYAESLENQYVHALAPEWFPQKSQGSALQKAAFHQPDLLLVYGGSELGYSDPYHANIIFAKYPTGFTLFTVGRARAEPLIIFEKLAAIGKELQGKKIVITLSPDFAMAGMTSPGGYAFNFSPLHAYELAFSTDLSPVLKQEAAGRMLEYSDTLKRNPLLRFALENLAVGSPESLALYYSVLPLGKLQTEVLKLQDHEATLEYLWSDTGIKAKVNRKRQEIKWEMLLQKAQESYAVRSNSNPFGILNEEWVQQYNGDVSNERNILSDKWFLEFIAGSKGWEDLELLLRELRELEAEPLVISSPIHGPYFDFLGVSAAARQEYYEKLERAVGSDDVPLLSYSSHDESKDFLIDPLFHLSSVGWVYYARGMDSFYHGLIPKEE